MPNELLVCNGCCCGRVEKGHDEVPIDTLKNAWEKYNLADHVNLKISTCLGPCSMHNVTLVKTDNGRTWLGKLNTEDHYLAIVDWALDVAQRGNDAHLPESLAQLRFDPSL